MEGLNEIFDVNNFMILRRETKAESSEESKRNDLLLQSNQITVRLNVFVGEQFNK